MNKLMVLWGIDFFMLNTDTFSLKQLRNNIFEGFLLNGGYKPDVIYYIHLLNLRGKNIGQPIPFKLSLSYDEYLKDKQGYYKEEFLELTDEIWFQLIGYERGAFHMYIGNSPKI